MGGEPWPAAPATAVEGVSVAAAYLAVALAVLAPVLGAPSERLPYPAALLGKATRLGQCDEQLVVARIAGNARRLLSSPTAVYAADDCYPLPAAVTLGEHALGESLAAALPVALGAEPVLAYNLVLLLWLWLPALAMYALVRHWTGSIPAAFTAGLLFAIVPQRVGTPAHPFVAAFFWAPLALLFAHRLFDRGRWRDAGALAAVLVLQLLESYYLVLALGVVGGTYGLSLAVRHGDRLRALLPKLAAVAGVVAAAVVVVFGPYLRARAQWDFPATRSIMLLYPSAFQVGGSHYPGTVPLALALVAVIDRLRPSAARRRDDPRLVLVVAGLLVLWCVVWVVRVPLVGTLIDSPLVLLRQWLPGLDMVRAPAPMAHAVYLVACALAGFGVAALAARRRALGWVVAGVACVLAATEVFAPGVAPGRFAVPTRLGAWTARPSAELRGLLAGLPEGAVLDVPFTEQATFGRAVVMAHGVFLAAYHRRPTAACYNSVESPVRAEIAALADRLPDPAAADALHALGFRSLILHPEAGGRAAAAWAARLAPLLASGRLVVAGGEGVGSGMHVVYRLFAAPEVVTGLAAIAAAGGDGAVVHVDTPEVTLSLPLANPRAAVWRQPVPVRPQRVRVRWQPTNGGAATESFARVLLPLALLPGQTVERSVRVAAPPAGAYEALLAAEAEPEAILGRWQVEVHPGAAR